MLWYLAFVCVNHVSYPKDGHRFACLRFPVLTAASVKMTAVWDIAPCNFVEVDGHFRGTYCLQGAGLAQAV
jgi:hypothetical protein